MNTRFVGFVAFLVVTLASSAAFACPVCGASKAENDWAFGVTTLLLSFMPPLMFLFGVVFFVRAHKKAARRELEDLHSTPPLAGGPVQGSGG